MLANSLLKIKASCCLYNQPPIRYCSLAVLLDSNLYLCLTAPGKEAKLVFFADNYMDC